MTIEMAKVNSWDSSPTQDCVHVQCKIQQAKKSHTGKSDILLKNPNCGSILVLEIKMKLTHSQFSFESQQNGSFTYK